MPIYANRNNHPVVVSITEPRISVTVFPHAWTRQRLAQGAKQEIELDEALARGFVRMGMLELLTTTIPTPPLIPAVTVGSLGDVAAEVIVHAGPEDVSIAESPHAVTEEHLSPAELTVRASRESQRVILRERAPSPPRKKRYAL